jgi:hypothetical protein
VPQLDERHSPSEPVIRRANPRFTAPCSAAFPAKLHQRPDMPGQGTACALPGIRGLGGTFKAVATMAGTGALSCDNASAETADASGQQSGPSCFLTVKETAARKYVIVSNDGPPCPRCRRPMEVREHDQIREKQLRQPYYYSRWFNCRHRDCRTTLCMWDEFKVWNDNQEGEQTRRLEAIRQQLRPRD